jgi:hypothetical protein
MRPEPLGAAHRGAAASGVKHMKTVFHCRHWSVIAAAAALALSATTASAAETDRARASDQSIRATGRAAQAEAPNARLAVLVQSGGNVIRRKGVQSVTRNREGEYCIRPSAGSGIEPSTAIVIASVEYFYSELDEVMVQWVSRGHDCGGGRIAVYTLADTNDDGIFGFSNLVGFSVIVP